MNVPGLPVLRAAALGLLLCAPAFADTQDGPDAPLTREAFVRAARRAGPAVVSVSRLQAGLPARLKTSDAPPAAPDRGNLRPSGVGSGVVVSPDGFVLTNRHVVQGADRLEVTLSDGRRFEGRLIGVDRRTDLAMIRIGASGLACAEFADSGALRTGQWVMAVGNPFGTLVKNPQPSVSVGVISALGRNLADPEDGDPIYGDLIQTDAALNMGNSGGPLVDLDGRVIGINTLIVSPTGGSVGLGFAIPSNRVRQVLPLLCEGKPIRYGWLGIQFQELTPDLAEAFHRPPDGGALVASTVAGGPAQRAGVLRGDVLTGIGPETVADPASCMARLLTLRAGDTVTLHLVRAGRELALAVALDEIPAEPEPAAAAPVRESRDWRGLTVASAPETRTPGCVVVSRIIPFSPPDQAGLRAGDRIDEVNGLAVGTPEEFDSAVKTLNAGRVLVHSDRGYAVVRDESA